ncbi:2-dehydropantoate 2-reductase [Pelagicoccus sp. SDUM812005]|uniref:2-dehydropantoate 2-reductase n=1 Tax=Pelagicoccus sp. SDUM812005 TaxID=3041257 RepID=UPI00280CF195|nr:2-dehydropantoate 2-reductase [Pelagicoccus sp. SDUM812005]MDQ8182896.1 2-dehydropantoate 2-reductase [Pelagicoccus sp. SDUM812005]
MKIAIVGPGAIGLYYGALLQRSGQEVAFLMRSDLAVAKEKGVKVVKKDETFVLDTVAAFGDAAEIGICDLVVVAMKATGNDGLAKILPPLVGEGTKLLTLQNGLGNDRLLAELFPENTVLGGLCFVCLNRTAPAVVENYMAGSVSIGPRVEGDLAAAREIADLFAAAGLKTRCEPKLREVQWKKLVWNVPFNGLAIAAGGVTTDMIVENEALCAEARALMAEILAAAQRFGYDFGDGFADYQIEITRPMGPYRPSSMIDFVEDRSVELEAIWGEPLRQAKEAGLAMPKLELLYALLKRLCR